VDTWSLVETFADRGSADLLAARLEAESIPVLVRATGAGPMLVGAFEVLVPPELAHRARWVLANSQLSDAELDALATRSPPAEPRDEED